MKAIVLNPDGRPKVSYYEQQRMTIIFNEWAARYAADPDSFSDILGADGNPVKDYGQLCAIYFEKIANELDAAGKLPLPVTNTDVTRLSD